MGDVAGSKPVANQLVNPMACLGMFKNTSTLVLLDIIITCRGKYKG